MGVTWLSQVFVVVPSDQCSSLENVFRRAGRQMPSGVPAGCAVQKVCICADSGDWTVHICAPADVDPGCAEAIQRAIADAAGVDGCVRLVFSGREIDPVPEPSAFGQHGPASGRGSLGRIRRCGSGWLRLGAGLAAASAAGSAQRRAARQALGTRLRPGGGSRLRVCVSSQTRRVSIEIGEFEEPEEPEVTPAERRRKRPAFRRG